MICCDFGIETAPGEERNNNALCLSIQNINFYRSQLLFC